MRRCVVRWRRLRVMVTRVTIVLLRMLMIVTVVVTVRKVVTRVSLVMLRMVAGMVVTVVALMIWMTTRMVVLRRTVLIAAVVVTVLQAVDADDLNLWLHSHLYAPRVDRRVSAALPSRFLARCRVAARSRASSR